MDQIRWVARYKISGMYAASARTYPELMQILSLLGENVEDVKCKTELWRLRND